MLLNRLRLKNIRSYAEAEILFPAGSVILAGDIGAGKSTILHAIEFALFGLRKSKLSGRAMLRHGATEGFAELEFLLDGRRIVIHRTLRAQKDDVRQDSGFIEINGIRSDLTALELKARILEMLGYPLSLLNKTKNLIFTYTVYTPQEEMKHILMDEADNRVDILRKVFGMDKYKLVLENSVIVARALQESIRHEELLLANAEGRRTLADQKKAQLAELQIEGAKLREEYDIAVANEAAAAAKFVQAKEFIDKAHAFSLKHVEAKGRVNALCKYSHEIAKEQELARMSIAGLRDSLQQPVPPHQEPKDEILQRVNTRQLFVQQLSNKKNILTERKEHLSKNCQKLASLAARRKELEGQLAAKQRDYDALLVLLNDKEIVVQRREELEDDVSAISTKLSGVNVQLQHIQSGKQRLAALSSCPTCFQEVSQSHKRSVLESQEATEKGLHENHLNLNTKKEVLERSLVTYKEREEQLLKRERTASLQRGELINLEQGIKELGSVPLELETTSMDLAHTDEELSLLDKQNVPQLYMAIETDKQKLAALEAYENTIRQYDERKRTIIEKENYLMELQAKKQDIDIALHAAELEEDGVAKDLVAFALADERYNAAQNEHTVAMGVLRNSEGAWNNVIGRQNSLREQCAELEAELMQMKQLAQQVRKRKDVHVWLNGFFYQLIVTLEKHLLVAIHYNFEEIFQHGFALLVEDENLSVQLDDMFTPVVIQNGYEVPFEHLSGGERTSCALAYRLALNRVINNVQSMVKTRDILILDEPTEGFSADQLDRVRLVLDELHLSQLIIVSHENKIEGFVDHLMKVVKEERGSMVIAGG